MSTYTIRYTRATDHIAGLEARTTGGGNDMGDHISYSAQTTCGALSRGGSKMAVGKTADDLATILRSAGTSRTICKNCEAAAKAMLAAQAEQEAASAPVVSDHFHKAMDSLLGKAAQ